MMTPSQDAAAMWGLAENERYGISQRLQCALQALEFFGKEYERLTTPVTATDEQRLFAAGEVRDILAEETGLNPGDCNRVTWRIVNALLPKDGEEA